MQHHIYVVGAGVMGTDIATAFLAAGHDVTLADLSLEAAQLAQNRIQKRWADKVMPAAFDVTLLDECRPAGNSMVIEAITESLTAKRQLLTQIGAYSDPTVTLFSNTSTLSISDLSDAVTHPERFAGLHFFFPAHRNPFLEVITAKQTSAATVETAAGLAGKLGKHHIVCRDRPGFVVNAFYLPLVNEAVRLVDEKLGTPSEIDSVAKTIFGLRVGPLAVTRMMSPETTRLTISALVGQGACPPLAASIADDTAGRFEVEESAVSVDQARETQIRKRLLSAVFFPCLRMLESGDVSESAIDTAAVRALQFSHSPIALMRQMGAAAVERVLNEVSSDWGGSVPSSVAKL